MEAARHISGTEGVLDEAGRSDVFAGIRRVKVANRVSTTPSFRGHEFMTPEFWAMTPFFKGHGESRWHDSPMALSFPWGEVPQKQKRARPPLVQFHGTSERMVLVASPDSGCRGWLRISWYVLKAELPRGGRLPAQPLARRSFFNAQKTVEETPEVDR